MPTTVVRVTNADGQWLVCDDLDGTGSSEPPAASEAPAASEVPAEPEAPAASEAPAA